MGEKDQEEERLLGRSQLSDHSERDLDLFSTPPLINERRSRRKIIAFSLAGLFLLAALLLPITPTGQKAVASTTQHVASWWQSSADQIDDAEEEVESDSIEAPQEIEEIQDTQLDDTASSLLNQIASVVEQASTNGFIDTQPPLPSSLVYNGPPNQGRYLSYLPHSGFHNQRVEFQNALAVAILLNRTLITPLVLAGRPMYWWNHDELMRRLSGAQKTRGKSPTVARCRPDLRKMEELGENYKGAYVCRDYIYTTELSWSFLSNLETLPSQASLLPMPDMNNAYFTKPVDQGGLGLLTSSTYRTQDIDERYGNAYWDTTEGQIINPGKYLRGVSIADMAQPPYSDYAMIETGSMFGSGRIVMTSSANKALYDQIQQAMVFRNPILESIALDIVGRLGGKDSFLGIHLRVGDGPFLENAPANMKSIFLQVSKKTFGLSDEAANQLFNQNVQAPSAIEGRSRKITASSHYDLADDMNAEDFVPDFPSRHRKRQASAQPYSHVDQLPLASSMSCHRPLHTDAKLLKFNTPVYIATDSRHPRQDPDLAVFFNTLPCAFILSDFAAENDVNQRAISDLVRLATLRSLQDGVRIGHFLYPFLEASVVARSRIGVYGTRGSTFSGFARFVLHDVYTSELR